MIIVEILTGLIEKVNLVGLIKMKPTTKENIYIVMTLLAFTAVLVIALYIERRLDAKRKEKRRRNNYIFSSTNIGNKSSENQIGNRNNPVLNMQSLDNVI